MALPRTITFQPDDDVRRLIASRLRAFGPRNRRGVKTRLINEALRRFAAETLRADAQKEAA